MRSRLKSFKLNYENSVGEKLKKITCIGKDGIKFESSGKDLKNLLEQDLCGLN